MPVSFEFNADKALTAVAYFAARGLPELTKGKICKLIFLADRLHLVRYGRPITGDSLVAMEHGPVPSRVLNGLNAAISQDRAERWAEPWIASFTLDRKFANPYFVAAIQPDVAVLSRSDLKVLNETIERYGAMSFNQLRAITHDFIAYKRAWESRTGDRGQIRFEDLFDDDGDPDPIEGAKEEMLENFALREALSA